MNGNVRTIRDAIKALQPHFTGSKPPTSLPADCRRSLRNFAEDFEGTVTHDDAVHVNEELKLFWDKHVGGSVSKLGAFVGVLKELRPAIVAGEDLLEWYHLAVKPVASRIGFKKAAVEDAQAFLASVTIYDDDDEDDGGDGDDDGDDDQAATSKQRSHLSRQICNDLIEIYIARTRRLTNADNFDALDNHQIAKQIEAVLVAFGKKMPRQLFHLLDDLVVREVTRLQGLTLLSTFLQNQAPHLYSVMHTPLIDSLLKCLMNDTSTTILAVALTSLIMLLPHIPSSLNSRLPRLFLIYSRLLCWEKFSPLSTAAQKSVVMDGRVADEQYDAGDVGIDLAWEKARPAEDEVEPSTPELLTYFTHLYGMYPLNFMSYIRKPRRYLKNIDFPGADDFDLDQVVIRSRSDQFRQVHLLHPNFYNMTIEEELLDPKWPKMDPADVVAECHGLAANSRLSTLTSPGPPPMGKLPELPALPPLPSAHLHGSASPAISNASLRSGTSWRDTVHTAVDTESPILKPFDSRDELTRPNTAIGYSTSTSPAIEDFPMPNKGFPVIHAPKEIKDARNNLEYLQQKLTGLQNELNFERWHKSQYSQHIGQLMRKNVKDATVEAETFNLINANRALRQQLEQVRAAREATMKDANLTRKQANNLEANITERFNKMKKEQETWAAESEELKRLRSEMKNYRDLLSTSESRELNKSHQVEMMKRDIEQLKSLRSQLQDAQRKNREYEFREFDFEQAKRELEIVQSEKETMQLRLQRQAQDRDRVKRVYSEKIVELEAQLGSMDSHNRRPSAATITASDTASQRELADAQGKLAQLKKAHSRLLERYTDLELEYQSVKSQLEAVQGYGSNASVDETSRRTSNVESMGNDFAMRSGVLESVYGLDSEYEAPASEFTYTSASTSDPTSNRYPGGNPKVLKTSVSDSHRQSASYSSAPHSVKPPSTSYSRRTDELNEVQGYNTTAPLRADECSVVSGNSSEERRKKITANSEVRVYGRGGAQNIKLKQKEEVPKKESVRKNGLKALKGIAGL